VVSVLWGANWPAMKVAVTEVSPWLFRSVCVGLAGVSLLTLAMAAREPVRLRLEHLAGFLVPTFLAVTCWNIFSAFGLQHMGGGRGAILAYTMPVWAALLAIPVLGERLDGRRIGALGLGMAGVAVLAGPDIVSGRADLMGITYMLLAAISWGFGIVMLKRQRTELGAMALTGWQLILGGVPIFVATLFQPVFSLEHLTWRGVAGTLYAAFIGLTFCFAAYNKLVLMLPAGIAAISALMVPVVGLISSAILLGEPIGAPEVLALALVVSAVALVLWPRRAVESVSPD
jgi:drug/metabolite transporter (DMT)-like permease